jgi:hypothetical protein
MPYRSYYLVTIGVILLVASLVVLVKAGQSAKSGPRSGSQLALPTSQNQVDQASLTANFHQLAPDTPSSSSFELSIFW